MIRAIIVLAFVVAVALESGNAEFDWKSPGGVRGLQGRKGGKRQPDDAFAGQPVQLEEVLGNPSQREKQRAYQIQTFKMWQDGLQSQRGKDLGDERAQAERVQTFFQEFYNSETICSQPEESTVLVRNRGAVEGLGSLLNGFLISAGQALMRGKRLCPNASKTVYVNKTNCPQQNWSCLFKEISPKCPCSELKRVQLEQMVITEAKRCITFPRDIEQINEKDMSNGINFAIFDRLSKLPLLGFKQELVDGLPRRNDHWYMGQLYGFYLRPNADMLEYKQNLIAHLFPGWDPEKSIAVHLRRGDHWMGVHLDDEAYLSTIRSVAETTGAKTVLLGTDDLRALETYPTLLAPLQVVSIPANYSVVGQNADLCKESKLTGGGKGCTAAKLIMEKEGGSDEGKLMMTQIYMMAESLVAIGNMGSNFGRVIHQLAWANHSGRYARTSPNLTFLDMSGDKYFICGWRLSSHTIRPNDQVVSEWKAKYAYFYGSSLANDN